MKATSWVLYLCRLGFSCRSSCRGGKPPRPGAPPYMQANYPKASISNGQVQAVLYLPDAKNGYYRASRFDWSGVIPCLAYKGHTYFGIWFSHYDPMMADAIAGPVEEFRSSRRRSGLRPGETRRSVRQDRSRRAAQGGRLRLTNSCTPIRWWMVASGRFTPAAAQVSFRQQLQSPIGIAYDYEKTVIARPP